MERKEEENKHTKFLNRSLVQHIFARLSVFNVPNSSPGTRLGKYQKMFSSFTHINLFVLLLVKVCTTKTDISSKRKQKEILDERKQFVYLKN